MNVIIPPIRTIQDAWRALDELARAINSLPTNQDGTVQVATTLRDGVVKVDNDSGGDPMALTALGHGAAPSPHTGHAHLIGGKVPLSELPALAGSPGPAGAPGSAGPPGAAGTSMPLRDGPRGAMGLPGPQGPPGSGAPGPTGSAGRDAPPGRDGARGAWGLPGPPGSTGATGAAGVAGTPGVNGITVPGIDGRRGADSFIPGPQGVQGPVGVVGPQGGIGPAVGLLVHEGRPGRDSFIPGPSGPVGGAGIQGPQGVAGQSLWLPPTIGSPREQLHVPPPSSNGWNRYQRTPTSSVADQAVPAATLTLLAGSRVSINPSKFEICTILRWSFSLSKTAVGTAASTFDVRIGTLGTTGDTARLSFVLGLGTAAVDVGFAQIIVTIRGPLSAAGIIQGTMILTHNGNTTGIIVIPVAVINATSAGFDVTVANLIASLSVTSGATVAFTFQQMFAEALNLG